MTRYRALPTVSSPSAFATSTSERAPGKSCLFANTATGFPESRGSRMVSSSASLASSARFESALSTTNTHACTSAT